MTINMDTLIERSIVNLGNLDKIKEVMDRAKHGQDITIGFIGGSITMGSVSSTPKTCYAYHVYSWWKTTFPESKVHYVNGGIGGTTSYFGVARVEEDLLKYYPDFVVVEFSVNDTEWDHFKETYEGLLRRILKSDSNPAVLIVNSVFYNTGMNVESSHNFIGKYYHLPIISMKRSIFEEVQYIKKKLHQMIFIPMILGKN